MRHAFVLLIVAAALGLAASALKDRSPEERLELAATALQGHIDVAFAELDHSAHVAVRRTGVDSASGHSDVASDAEELRKGRDGWRLYRDREVIRWTDRAPISDAELDTVTDSHLSLPDGLYLHAVARRGRQSVHVLRQVWFQPPFENHYLKRHFAPGFEQEAGIIATQISGAGPVVHDPHGHFILRLKWEEEPPPPGTRSLIGLILALAAIGCVVAALWHVTMQAGHPWRSIALFAPALIVGRWATLLYGPFDALRAYPLFDPSLFASSILMPSLGDLLINAIIALCIAAFVHRMIAHAARPRRPMIVAGIALSVLFAGAEVINGVLIALVHDSSVGLDLFHIQSFDAYSWIALFAIPVILLAWVVLADACIRAVAPVLDRRQGLMILVVFTLIFIGIHHLLGNYDLMLALWPFTVLVILGRLRRKEGIIPVLLLIAALALFTAHVLNRQTLRRMAMDRSALAETVTTREDPVIELLFHEVAKEVRSDRRVVSWLRTDPPCNATDLDRLIRQAFFTGYWDRYDMRLYLFSADGGLRCSNSPDAPPTADQLMGRFEQGMPTASDPELHVTDRPGEEALYLGRMEVAGAVLYVELRPRLITDGLGFPELLLAGERRTENRFIRARYERGVLTDMVGGHAFPIDWTGTVTVEGLHFEKDGFDLLAQGDPHGTLSVLGMRIPGWEDHVTTFSYLFLLFCLFAGLLSLLRMIIAGPRPFVFSIRGKVRFGVMLFAMVSLVLFTIGVRNFLHTHSTQRAQQTLNERARGVIAELRQTVGGERALEPAMMPDLDHLLGQLSNVFFTDLTLYAPDGRLLASSREQVFNTGLLGRRMDPEAYYRSAIQGASSFIHSEQIGTADFSVAYMPFRNEQGEALAFLALPYFARQGEIEQERAAGYVALVNLFTLLFLLSVVAAALITTWTTRPLHLLKRGLERIGLGTRNEPIHYQGRDELGELVRIYNQKVEELRDSAQKLARSERESAWREMAKQVAHEITNPLTPMKLNIQQFQRTWTPELPHAKERLDRLSDGLVQQIDALGRIAGEFAHFAQMPPAHEQDLDLGEVAATAVSLFSSSPSAEVVLEGSVALMIHADREHLLRIFNNLVKNALQAIPEGRPGEVTVRLRSEGEEAIVEVHDNGSGIPEEWQQRIFTPSFTTKSSGMGLGLSMVKRMAEQAGGRVWFNTSKDAGTSFFVALPLARSHSDVPDPG